MIGRLPWFGLLALLVLSPLPLGMVPPAASSLAGLWLALLVAGWAMLAAAGRAPAFWHRALWVPLLLFGGVVAWIFVQMHWTIAPGPVARAAAAVLHRPVSSVLNQAPAQATVALLALLIPVAAFWLSLHYGRDAGGARTLLSAFVAAQLACAVYGLINYIAGNRLLLWFPREIYPGDVTGTLINRNNYATLAGLGLLTACALAWEAFAWALERAPEGPSRFVRAVEALKGRPALFLFSAAVIAMAWLQSHSRMGFASTVLALLVMVSLGGVRGPRRFGGTGLLLAGVTGALLLYVSGTQTLDRMDIRNDGDRSAILGTAIRAVERAPWTGSGAGAFVDAFASVRDGRLPQPGDYAIAHDAYLQAAVELGVPATAALVLAIFWLIGLCGFGCVRRRRDRLFPVLGVGAGVLVATHSLLDFSVQIPAVAIASACLLGVAVAQSFPSEPQPA